MDKIQITPNLMKVSSSFIMFEGPEIGLGPGAGVGVGHPERSAGCCDYRYSCASIPCSIQGQKVDFL